ncbi:MAG: MBOAT family protein [Bacteroidales bacterium]|nr:MBOAT family protein [Bacteroidales bacterium]
MVFSSSLFLLVFLPLFILAYYVSGRKHRNLVSLVASILFYMWGGPWFIFIVLASIWIDFQIVREMAARQGRFRRYFLAASVVLNVGLLVYFKYANFLVDNFNELLTSWGMNAVHWTRVALPIGISFFTFQKISYSVDVFRRKHGPLQRVRDYALYILLFPQLIAGPIVRYHEIADQLIDRSQQETAENRMMGLFRFILGLSKKVLIANVLGEQVDLIFATDPARLSTPLAWLGVVAYSFQIYYDFSGYSDMAIGIGRMIGFRFPENFNNPYISRNITEFWRRWHITLSRWMKDYLYIPLGGNRVKTRFRLYINLWVVFLISGLWHGAAWNFVIWGAFHGFFLIFDRLFLIRLTDKIGKIPSVLLTYLITLIGWVLFRAASLRDAWAYLHTMFSFRGTELPSGITPHFWFFMITAGFFAFFALVPGVEQWQVTQLEGPYRFKKVLWVTPVFLLLLLYCMGSITSSGFNPFIYFRF